MLKVEHEDAACGNNPMCVRVAIGPFRFTLSRDEAARLECELHNAITKHDQRKREADMLGVQNLIEDLNAEIEKRRTVDTLPVEDEDLQEAIGALREASPLASRPGTFRRSPIVEMGRWIQQGLKALSEILFK